MEKNCKLDMTPEELVALASSLAITIGNNFDFSDIASLRAFFLALSNNLTLIETQYKNRHRSKN